MRPRFVIGSFLSIAVVVVAGAFYLIRDGNRDGAVPHSPTPTMGDMTAATDAVAPTQPIRTAELKLDEAGASRPESAKAAEIESDEALAAAIIKHFDSHGRSLPGTTELAEILGAVDSLNSESRRQLQKSLATAGRAMAQIEEDRRLAREKAFDSKVSRGDFVEAPVSNRDTHVNYTASMIASRTENAGGNRVRVTTLYREDVPEYDALDAREQDVALTLARDARATIGLGAAKK